jgi:hypothetical protein
MKQKLISKYRGTAMSQAINLKDAGSKLRNLVQSLRSANEECEVKDDTGQTVAVVLPADKYESYQAYQRQREADFAVFDRVADAFKDVDPNELETRINQAAEEVKADRNVRRATV